MDREKIKKASELCYEESRLVEEIKHLEALLANDGVEIDCMTWSTRSKVLRTIEQNWEIFTPMLADFFRDTIRGAINNKKERLRQVTKAIDDM